MSKNNRATLINKVLKLVKKHYKPVAPNKQKSVLEHLLYACCLENSTHEAADQVFESLVRDYFDWNEVRVSSIRELTVVLKPLNDPAESAKRLKRVLQSVFESLYSFDLDPLKKQNIGKTAKQILGYNGTTRFTVSYVTQNGLGGHSIPVNDGLLEAMRVVGVVSDAEAAKGTVPGLERVVQKTRGIEVGSLLHQLGVELYRSPYGPTIRKLLLEVDPECKSRLPKRPSKKKATPPPVEKEKAEKEKPKKPAPKKKTAPAAKAKAAPAKPAAKKPVKKTAAQGSPSAAKSEPAKKTVKKAAPKKVVKKTKAAPKKSKAAKTAKKSSTKQLKKRKPR